MARRYAKEPPAPQVTRTARWGRGGSLRSQYTADCQVSVKSLCDVEVDEFAVYGFGGDGQLAFGDSHAGDGELCADFDAVCGGGGASLWAFDPAVAHATLRAVGGWLEVACVGAHPGVDALSAGWYECADFCGTEAVVACVHDGLSVERCEL